MTPGMSLFSVNLIRPPFKSDESSVEQAKDCHELVLHVLNRQKSEKYIPKSLLNQFMYICRLPTGQHVHNS